MAEQKWPSWPAWYYGPAGAAAIFERAEDIPPGWADAPGKVQAHSPDQDTKVRKPRLIRAKGKVAR